MINDDMLLQLLYKGEKTKAIQLLREQDGLCLKDAKEYVDRLSETVDYSTTELSAPFVGEDPSEADTAQKRTELKF